MYPESSGEIIQAGNTARVAEATARVLETLTTRRHTGIGSDAVLEGSNPDRDKGASESMNQAMSVDLALEAIRKGNLATKEKLQLDLPRVGNMDTTQKTIIHTAA